MSSLHIQNFLIPPVLLLPLMWQQLALTEYFISFYLVFKERRIGKHFTCSCISSNLHQSIWCKTTEQPSQTLQKWAWEPAILQKSSEHSRKQSPAEHVACHRHHSTLYRDWRRFSEARWLILWIGRESIHCVSSDFTLQSKQVTKQDLLHIRVLVSPRTPVKVETQSSILWHPLQRPRRKRKRPHGSSIQAGPTQGRRGHKMISHLTE